MDKYGYLRQRPNGKYELMISLGFNSEGKRIRKSRNVKAASEAEALVLLRNFYLEYKNVIFRNKETLAKRKMLKKDLHLYCQIYCHKETCKDNNCKAYAFYKFQYNRILEEYNF